MVYNILLHMIVWIDMVLSADGRNSEVHKDVNDWLIGQDQELWLLYSLTAGGRTHLWYVVKHPQNNQAQLILIIFVLISFCLHRTLLSPTCRPIHLNLSFFICCLSRFLYLFFLLPNTQWYWVTSYGSGWAKLQYQGGISVIPVQTTWC